jgi:hypothetical protein
MPTIQIVATNRLVGNGDASILIYKLPYCLKTESQTQPITDTANSTMPSQRAVFPEMMGTIEGSGATRPSIGSVVKKRGGQAFRSGKREKFILPSLNHSRYKPP